MWSFDAPYHVVKVWRLLKKSNFHDFFGQKSIPPPGMSTSLQPESADFDFWKFWPTNENFEMSTNLKIKGGTFFPRIWSDLNKSLRYRYFDEFLKYGNDSWCKWKLRCCSKRCKSFLPQFFALNIGNLHVQIRFSLSLLCKKRG